MENRYQHTIDGQEVNEIDLNTIATEASLADDRTLAEVFRLAQVGSTNPGGVASDRGIVAGDPASEIVRPSGSANATVNIAAFRAFLGAISPSDSIAARKDIRSFVAAATTVQFPAITTNPRWDLVYARLDVDIDGPSVSRFVKTGTTPATQQSVVTTKVTTITIGRVQGTESTSPAPPAIPADSGSSYYIPVAYVLLPAGHTLTTAIAKANINEAAKILMPSAGAGACSLSPASVNHVGAGREAGSTWSISGRDQAYIPPTMVGKIEKVIALHFGGTRTIALGASSVLDNTIDWRNRIFKALIAGGALAGAYQLPWVPAGSNYVPDGRAVAVYQSMGQSFHTNGSSAGGEIALINTSTLNNAITGGPASVEVYVDMSTGFLMAKVSATDPACDLIIWIEATGSHNNAF